MYIAGIRLVNTFRQSGPELTREEAYLDGQLVGIEKLVKCNAPDFMLRGCNCKPRT